LALQKSKITFAKSNINKQNGNKLMLQKNEKPKSLLTSAFNAHKASFLLLAAVTTVVALLLIAPVFATSTNPCSACHGNQGYSETLSLTANQLPTNLEVGQTATVTILIQNAVDLAQANNQLSGVSATLSSQNGHFTVGAPSAKNFNLMSDASASVSWQITAVSAGADEIVISATAQNNHNNIGFYDFITPNPTITISTPTPTPAPTPIVTPTPIPTPIATPTPIPTPIPSPIPTPIVTPTPTPIPTSLPSPTPTQTPTPTPIITPTPTPPTTPTPPPATQNLDDDHISIQTEHPEVHQSERQEGHHYWAKDLWRGHQITDDKREYHPQWKTLQLTQLFFEGED
jgi:hypothetical protein